MHIYFLLLLCSYFIVNGFSREDFYYKLDFKYVAELLSYFALVSVISCHFVSDNSQAIGFALTCTLFYHAITVIINHIFNALLAKNVTTVLLINLNNLKTFLIVSSLSLSYLYMKF